MLLFLHTYHPSPIIFKFGLLTIHWYGLLLAIAIIGGYFLAINLAKRASQPARTVDSICFSLLIAGLVGGRLYHVLNEWSFYLHHPLKILVIWEGGMAIHGAIIAGVVVIYYYAKKYSQSFWPLADLFSLPLILGQAIGRWGNYFNQELFGRPTDLSWGIPIDITNRPAAFVGSEYFHPTFLYESLWDFFVFIILFVLFIKKSPPPGFIFWLYLCLYSLGRVGVELLRIDRVPMLGTWRLPLLVSVILVLISAVMIGKRLCSTK